MTNSLPAFSAALAHAAPVFLDRDATLDKMDGIIAEARHKGARLVAFPESFLPGFPLWALVHAPVDTHDFFRRLHDQSLDAHGPGIERIGAMARRHGVYLSVGVTERSPVSVGTLYNTNLLFGPEGALLNRRRKLMPTWAEKLVWAQGDAAGLQPVRTEIGQLGILICGENTNPLARYALIAQGEQVHISTYPPVWPFSRKAPPDYAQWVITRSVAHSFEAKVFNLTVAGHLDEATITAVAAGDDRVEKVLREAPSAISLVTAPTGEPVGESLSGAEGLLIVPIDVAESIVPKTAHDVAGHYQRHDLFSLTLDQRPQEPIRLIQPENGPAATAPLATAPPATAPPATAPPATELG
jgi:predicted amidohydrolase